MPPLIIMKDEVSSGTTSHGVSTVATLLSITKNELLATVAITSGQLAHGFIVI